MEFSGKIALVTGASTGIGRATAEILAARGASVAVHYNSSRGEAEEVCAGITASGGRAFAVKADLRKKDEIASLRDTVHGKLGPIDILINNAGGLVQRCEMRLMSEEVFDEVMNLNFKSLFLVTQAFADDMIAKNKGVIVNMASVAARNGGGIGAGVYAASKAAALCLTKSMAKELLPHGIRVNAVNPGIILTPFHDKFTAPAVMEKLLATIPLARGAAPLEVAEVIAFLASERASYLVGETIEINGGMLME